MTLATGSKMPPIGWAILALLLGLVVAMAGSHGLQAWTGTPMTSVELCLATGGLAAAFGALFRLPLWWVPVNGLFPIGLYFLASTDIPGWVFLLCFVALALFYWNAAGERVPLYLSNRTTWRALGDLVDNRHGPFLDLGCGFGGTLFYLAGRYPDRSFVGIESAPVPYLITKLRAFFTRRANVKIMYGDFWQLDFAAFETLYAFLSPAPMARLHEKAQAELKDGGQLISNSFAVPGIAPEVTITLEDKRKTRLLVWHFRPADRP